MHADIGEFSKNSLEFTKLVLKEAKVAITPGLDFDPSRGNSTIRFSYARNTEEIVKGLERMKSFMKKKKYI